MRDLINLFENGSLVEMTSYHKVIPRDLFNDANLLKCYGQIYINLVTMDVDAQLVGGNEGFRIEQNVDGDTYLGDVHLIVRGDRVKLSRPLNSRKPYPLYLVNEDWEEIEVFHDNGQFTEEMVAFLTGEAED